MASADRQTIFRRRRRRSFTQIGNTPLRDSELSLEAVGFLCCILALPDDWSFNRSWARKRFDIGREKLDRIVKELTAARYCVHYQDRDESGRMGGSVYVFTDEPGDFDEPDDEQPLPEKPLPGKPSAGKSAPTNTENLQNTKSTKKRERASDAKAPRPRPSGKPAETRQAADKRPSEKPASTHAGQRAPVPVAW